MASSQKVFALVSSVCLVTVAFAALPAFIARPVAAETATTPLPTAPVPRGAGEDSATVGEEWIVGPQTMSGVTMAVPDRIRVLPGAHLTITGSTLTFAAVAGSGTGLVAEPGSIVDISGSTFQSSDATAAGTYTVNLEGQTTMDGVAFRDPAEVVVSPRPATDQLARLLGAELAHAIDDEAVVAADLAPGALLHAVTVTNARGAGLVVAPAPVGDRVPLEKLFGPAAQGNVYVNDSLVTGSAGPGILCYSTRESPSLDAGNVLVAIAPGVPHLELDRDTLVGNAGGGISCPTSPTVRALPARVLPTVGGAPPAPLDQSPVPRAVPMTGGVKVTRLSVSGAGTGLSFRAPAALSLVGATFSGLPLGIDLDRTKATMSNVVGVALGDGIHVAAADLTLTGTGSILDGGMGSGTGLAVAANTTSLNGASLNGFLNGVAVTGGTVTLTNAPLNGHGAGTGVAVSGGSLSIANDAVQGFATAALVTAGTLALGGATLTSHGHGVGVDVRGGTASAASALTVTGFETAAQVSAGSLSLTNPSLALLAGDPNARGLVATGGSTTVNGGSIVGQGSGVGITVAGGAFTATSATVRGVATGLLATSPATFRSGTIDQTTSGAVFSGVTSGEISSSTVSAASGVGVTLDRGSGVSVQSNTFTNDADPLVVLSTATPQSAHWSNTVTGNTVNGLALSYVANSNAAQTVIAAVGDVVVGFSKNVTYTDLDLSHGTYHVTASSDVVLGAKMTKTEALLNRTSPSAFAGFDRVWHGVKFEQYPGSLHGGQGTLDQNRGNDLDQAMALTLLYHKQGFATRFVDGQFTLTQAAYLDWTGMTNPNYAFGMFGFKGQWFGATANVQHTWIELAVAPGLWVTLDSSFDQYAWTDPLDLNKAAGINMSALVTSAEQGVSVDYATHSAVNVNANATMNQFNASQVTLKSYVDAHPALSTLALDGGVRVRPIAASEEPTARTVTSRYAQVPESRLWSIRIHTSESGVAASNELDFTATTTDVYGQKLTIESSPSTQADVDYLTANGGPYHADTSGYKMTTFLFVNRTVVAADGVIPQANGTFYIPPGDQRPIVRHAGELLDLAIEVREPGGKVFDVKHSPLRVGGTYAVALEIGRVSAPLLDRMLWEWNRSLIAWQTSPSTTEIPKNTVTGMMMELQGLLYFQGVRATTDQIARNERVVAVPLVSVAVTGTSQVPTTRYNATRGVYVNTVYSTPPYIDVESLEYSYPKDGDTTKLAQYNLGAGFYGSVFEDKTFTGMYDLPSVSTIKILAEANRLGVRLYHLNASEEAAVLPHLSALPTTVLNMIKDEVSNGRDIVVPEHPIAYYNWSGVGWIEYNRSSGAAGWLIYGGTAPPTSSDRVVPEASVVLSGGAGCVYLPVTTDPSDPNKRFDLGYVFLGEPMDWGTEGAGTVLGWGAAAEKLQGVNTALQPVFLYTPEYVLSDGSILYSREFGVVAYDQLEGLGNVLDKLAPAGKYLEGAGYVLAFAPEAIEAYKIATNPDEWTAKNVAQVSGEVALDAAGVIAADLATDAIIGAAVGDGPGAVVGAVVGVAVAALTIGYGTDVLKRAWKSFLNWW